MEETTQEQAQTIQDKKMIMNKNLLTWRNQMTLSIPNDHQIRNRRLKAKQVKKDELKIFYKRSKV